MHVIVTTPKAQFASAVAEAEYAKENPDSFYFRTFTRFPAKLFLGDNIFYVYGDYIRGFGVVCEIKDEPIECTVTKFKSGKARSAIVKAESWKWVHPIPYPSFRGWRYYRGTFTVSGDWLSPMPAIVPPGLSSGIQRHTLKRIVIGIKNGNRIILPALWPPGEGIRSAAGKIIIGNPNDIYINKLYTRLDVPGVIPLFYIELEFYSWVIITDGTDFWRTASFVDSVEPIYAIEPDDDSETVTVELRLIDTVISELDKEWIRAHLKQFARRNFPANYP